MSKAVSTSEAKPLPAAESSQRLPIAISHYTNLQGFIGMVEHDQVWASNVAYLNDREELLHGVKCASRALTKLLHDRRLTQWNAAIEGVVRQMEAGRMPNTYAACFCEKGDLLNQWRGYGGSEQGISLRFDRKKLASIRKGKKSFLAPVEYGLVRGKASITLGLRERLLAVTENELSDLGGDKEETVYRILSELIPRFKHIGFQNEMEWRFVVQHETLRSSVCYRAGRNVVIPYLKLGEEGTRLPLKSVTVGPGNDTDLTKKSVESFLKAKGYEIPVHVSKVPFRT
jgi:hypothetical protein